MVTRPTEPIEQQQVLPEQQEGTIQHTTEGLPTQVVGPTDQDPARPDGLHQALTDHLVARAPVVVFLEEAAAVCEVAVVLEEAALVEAALVEVEVLVEDAVNTIPQLFVH
jgi:hypothetical protein